MRSSRLKQQVAIFLAFLMIFSSLIVSTPQAIRGTEMLPNESGYEYGWKWNSNIKLEQCC